MSVPVLGSMFLAGIAGSLHCAGMCGPLLVGFSRVAGRGGFAWYHLGRVWTYALLGLAAGVLGRGVVLGGAWLGWQRGASVLLALLVLVVAAVLLAGPRLAPAAAPGYCAIARLASRGTFGFLARVPGPTGRFLLGVVMGFLPCGLVYAMLALAASLASPVSAALAMAAFGAGTVPALTGMLLATRVLPARLRRQGTRLAAVTLLATSSWMLARALAVGPGERACPLASCHSDRVPSAARSPVP